MNQVLHSAVIDNKNVLNLHGMEPLFNEKSVDVYEPCKNYDTLNQNTEEIGKIVKTLSQAFIAYKQDLELKKINKNSESCAAIEDKSKVSKKSISTASDFEYKEPTQELFTTLGVKKAVPENASLYSQKSGVFSAKNTLIGTDVHLFSGSEINLSKGSTINIYVLIQEAFSKIVSAQQSQLFPRINELEMNTDFALELTEFANYLHGRWADIERQPSQDENGKPKDKRFEWGSNDDDKKAMNQLFDYMRSHDIKVGVGADDQKQTIDEWLPKDSDGNVIEWLDLKQLYTLKESLQGQVKRRTEFFTPKLQTMINALTQAMNNALEALSNMISTQYRTARSIIEGLR